MIIQYYSDSLGLPRPGIVKLGERYIDIFVSFLSQDSKEKIHLIDRARSAHTIDKLYRIFSEDEGYIDGKKDILIIHEGICDCAPRPVSAGMRRAISVMPGFIRKRIISFLHNNRDKLLKNGSVHYLVSIADYESILRKWLIQAGHSFQEIYLFTIAPTNSRIEQHSPGFTKSINAYNAVIRKVVAEINHPSVTLIDIHSTLSNQSDLNSFIVEEDGHHITARAHGLYAEELIKARKLRSTR